MSTAKYCAFLWITSINLLPVYCEVTDEIQCDVSACLSPDSFNLRPISFDCFLLEGDEENDPITCDSDTEFKHPNLVALHSAFIEYTCCNIDDGSFRKYYHNSPNHQCDATACSSKSRIHPGNDCVRRSTGLYYKEPITCKHEDFHYPSLVSWDGILVVYNCCKVHDGSFSDAGLPLSPLGGYVQTNAVYFSTVFLLIISATSVFLLSLLMTSILASPGARLDSFNVYLVFLAIPDWFLNLYTLIILLLQLADKTFENFYLVFGASSGFLNNFINMIICYEIKKMVLRSHQRIGTNPPTIKHALVQCLTTFILSILWGTALYMFLSLLYVSVGVPYLIFLAAILFPFIYSLHALWRIRKTGILSLTGRTRSLTIYFHRILLVFVIFLIPGQCFGIMALVILVVNHTKSGLMAADRLLFTSTCLILLQGGVTAVVAMAFKPDIRTSAKKIMGFYLFYHIQKKRWLLNVEKSQNWRLINAPARILHDKEIIKRAIQNNPSEENILHAIRQTGWALQYGLQDMKDNFEIVLGAVGKWGAALQHASTNLRCNDEIVATAVRQMPTALQFALGGRNQSKIFLKTAGIFEDINEYNADKPRIILSTRFSLGENTSTTATIFALLMKQHPYFKQSFNIYFPNAYDKNTCDPEWTNIGHMCRGTFDTCKMDDELKVGVPQEHKSCWRYSYRYELEIGVAMVQVIEYYYAGQEAGNSKEEKKVDRHVAGNGQSIETEMANLVGRKVFRCFQPVNEGRRFEFDAGTIDDVAKAIEKWYEEDPENLEECNLRWKHVLGSWWLQEEN